MTGAGKGHLEKNNIEKSWQSSTLPVGIGVGDTVSVGLEPS